MINHPALSKAAIAWRYYNKINPSKIYTNEGARKQFIQDRNIDKKIVLKILDEIHKEARAMILKETKTKK